MLEAAAEQFGGKSEEDIKEICLVITIVLFLRIEGLSVACVSVGEPHL